MIEREINERIAERVRSGDRLNGRHFSTGQCVALLDGKVVAVANDLASALRALRDLDSDPRRGMVFEVRPPVMDVIR